MKRDSNPTNRINDRLRFRLPFMLFQYFSRYETVFSIRKESETTLNLYYAYTPPKILVLPASKSMINHTTKT